MPCIGFESPEGQALKNRILLADSSFVLAYLLPQELEPFHAVATKFFLDHRRDNLFQINFTVKLEVLRRIRATWVKSQLKQEDPELYKRVRKWAPRDQVKEIQRVGQIGIIRRAVEQKLRPYEEKIEELFEYEMAPVKGALVWSDAVDIMESYLLDSADATILNFALSMKFDGVVACDRDFEFDGPLPEGFRIYLPDRLCKSS